MTWLRNVAVVFLLLPFAALAQDSLPYGPKVGEPIPHQLGAVDQAGASRDFASLKGEAGLILLFNRSVVW